MNKKKIIITVLVLIVVGAASVITVGFLKKNNRSKKVVEVYPVSEIGSSADNFYYEDTLSGNVVADKEQKLYIGQDQKIKEIKVTVGQKVKSGDVLLVYDTTAQQLQVETKEAAVEMARTAVIVAERELKKLQNTTPVEPQPEEPEKPDNPVEPENPDNPSEPENPDNPSEPENPDNPSEPENPENPSEPENPDNPSEPENPDNPSEPENPDNPGEPENPENPSEPDNTDDNNLNDLEAGSQNDVFVLPAESDDDIDFEITYTKEELAEAIAAKKEEITRLKLDYEIMQVELEILKYQTSNGEVLSNFDGVVKLVNDPEEAVINNEPVVVVGGNGGYTVNVYLGENSLAKVTTGDYVGVNCYDTGMYYEGLVTEISNIPAENYYSDGQESYYPVTISLTDAEDLSQGMWVEVYLNSSVPTYNDSVYIELPFVKKEDGAYYVMKELDGKLVKCNVAVGKTMWNTYIEIKSGVTMDDYLAFPYLQDAQEGVKAERKSYYEAMGY